MATRNIVPRADGEGQVGLAAQAWGKVYADEIYEGGSRISDDKKVKASSTDASPGYLDAKVDGTSIEISGDKLSVKQTFLATTSAAGLMFAADKAKLDGIAENANNYAHPANHAPSVISQDANNRFVTDAEKATWNGKASTAVVTTSAAGLMSAADKIRLDALELAALTIASIESY